MELILATFSVFKFSIPSISLKFSQFLNQSRHVVGLALAKENICQAVRDIAAANRNLIIITNEVFADGLPYDQTTLDYIKTLGKINEFLAEISDVFIEAVYAIPVFRKGDLPWQL